MYRYSRLPILRVMGTIALVFTLSPAIAQDLSKYCSESQSFLNENKPLKALDVLRGAVLEVWNSVPLHVEKAVLITEKAKGYEKYDARRDNVYKPGEIIRLYVEPIGLTRKKEGDQYLTEAALDYTLAKEDGKVLTGKENFGELKAKTRTLGTNDYVDFDYNFTGLKPGNYVITTVIRDLIGSKMASVSTPVRIE